MKIAKISLIFLFFALFSPRILGQESGNVHFGLFLGANNSRILSNFDQFDQESRKNRVGFSAGGYFKIDVKDPVYIQTEVYASGRKAELAGISTVTDENDISSSTHYLQKISSSTTQISMLFGVDLWKKNDIKISSFAGPMLSMLNRPNIKVYENSIEIKAIEKQTILNGSFGINLAYQALFINLRYDIGLSEVFEFNGFKSKTHGFMVVIGGQLF